MPISAHLFPEHELIVSQFVGVITDEQFMRYYEQLVERDDGSKDFPELVDLRSAARFAPTMRALSIIGSLVSSIYKPSEPSPAHRPRCAVVAPFDLAYGVARMYQLGTSSDKVDLKVFRTLDSALIWLELDDEALRQRLNALNPKDASVTFSVQ